MLKSTLGFIVTFSLSTSLFADVACKTVDMTSDPGFKDSKDILQGNTQWCVSYSLAHLISQKLKQPISAYDLVFRHGFYSPERTKIIKTEEFQPVSKKETETLFEKEPWVCPQSNYTELPAAFHKTLLQMEIQKFKRSHCNSDDVSWFFKNISQLAQVQESVRNSSDVVEFVKKLNDENCQNKIAFHPKFEQKTFMNGWDQTDRHEQSSRYLREMLNRKKMVSISIDYYFFFDDGASILEKQKAHLTGGHRATLVGMTERNGECFYQVRDSAFAEERLCASAGNAKVRCLDNAIYEVKESDLAKALKGTVVLQD